MPNSLILDMTLTARWTEWVAGLGSLAPLILFAYGFSQTGLLLGPLVPGNPFLLAIGVWAASTSQVVPALLAVTVGASAGTWANYAQGKWLAGRWTGLRAKPRFARHWDRTEAFYARSGVLASFIANFLPFARALSPFVAGATGFTWKKFAFVAPLGAVCWTGLVVSAGAFLGRFKWVQDNLDVLTVVFVGIVFLAPVVPLLLRRRSSPTS